MVECPKCLDDHGGKFHRQGMDMVNTANLSQFKHVEAGKHVGEPTSPHSLENSVQMTLVLIEKGLILEG